MTNEEILELLAEVLDTEDFSITSSLDDFDWDSAARFSFKMAAEARGVNIDGSAIRGAKTVGDLMALFNV